MARSEFNQSGSTAPQPSGSPAQNLSGSPSPTGGAEPRPFVTEKFDLPMLDDDGDNYALFSRLRSSIADYGLLSTALRSLPMQQRTLPPTTSGVSWIKKHS
jgi:hypothetical protein